MKAYLLTPVSENLDNNKWQASIRRVACIAIADDERQARRRASSSLVFGVEKFPKSVVLTPPWEVSELVTCEQIEINEGELVTGDVITVTGELHRDGDFLRLAEWPF